MCATIDNVNEEKPGKTPDNTGRGKTLYGTCYYSDSLLDAVQSGLLFFDSDGIVFGSIRWPDRIFTSRTTPKDTDSSN